MLAALTPLRLGYALRVLSRVGVELPGATVLDLGCGGGILAEEFARLGGRVIGVDPSTASLRTARAHAARSSLSIEYVTGCGEHLPLAATACDVVICCDTLEHVADLDAVVGEVARVLRPGGVFVYDTINRSLLSALIVVRLAQEWRWSRFLPPDLHDPNRFITPVELRARLRRRGLRSGEQTGVLPGIGPLRALWLLWRQRRGAIDYGELGRGLVKGLRPGGPPLVLYLGWARKAAGGR